MAANRHEAALQLLQSSSFWNLHHLVSLALMFADPEWEDDLHDAFSLNSSNDSSDNQDDGETDGCWPNPACPTQALQQSIHVH